MTIRRGRQADADAEGVTLPFSDNIRTTTCRHCGEKVGLVRARDGTEGQVDIAPRAVWAPALGTEVILCVRGHYPQRVQVQVDGAPICEAWIPHRLTCPGRTRQ